MEVEEADPDILHPTSIFVTKLKLFEPQLLYCALWWGLAFIFWFLSNDPSAEPLLPLRDVLPAIEVFILFKLWDPFKWAALAKLFCPWLKLWKPERGADVPAPECGWLLWGILEFFILLFIFENTVLCWFLPGSEWFTTGCESGLDICPNPM